MHDSISTRLARAETRTSIFYATLFMQSGAATVFAAIWMQDLGLDARQIGLITAFPVLLLLASNIFVGRLADRAADWRSTIVAGCLIAGVMPLGLFWAGGFWSVLLLWSGAVSAVSLIVPVLDAAAMRMCRRRGLDFASIRAWGTVGYLAVILATGFAVERWGGWLFVPIFVALGLARAAVSLLLPRFRAEDHATRRPVPGPERRLRQVLRPWFVAPLLGWAMVFATHLVLNSFQALLWQEQGIAADVAGMLIAIGAGAEAIMFFAFRRIAGRFTARNLILISAAVTVLRFIAMGFSPGVPMLVFLQSLHAITYALGFLGCINFIANWTEEDIAAEAQSFFVVLQQAMAVLTLAGFGLIAEQIGARAYFAAAAFAALGGCLVWISIRLRQPAARV